MATVTSPPTEAIRATIDTHIRVRLDDLDRQLYDFMFHANTFPNPEYKNAKDNQVPGWQGVPQSISLASHDGDHVVFPRGFALRFKRGLARLGRTVDWDMNLAEDPLNFSGIPAIQLRSYQVPAVERILAVQQGIYQAPTGSGKTVTALEAIRRAGQRSLVVCNSVNLALQWKKAAKEHFGEELGFVGDGEWDERPITVAIQQTLWARRAALDQEGWWAKFGFVCLDECHHVPADTFMHTMQRFPARWRIGVSATPDRETGVFPIAKACMGEVFHVTDEHELYEGGYLVKPSVKIVRTDFKFDFVHTHRAKSGQLIRNNYHKLVAELQDDDDRNRLIASEIVKQRGHAVLVLSDRLGHLDELRRLVVDKGWPADRAFMFTGREDGDERMEVARKMETGDAVVFSTLADEGVDIPRLDRLHLTWPTRNTTVITQRMGRVKRPHGSKQDAIVTDYMDDKVRVLHGQANARRRLYRSGRLTVTDTTVSGGAR